MENRNDIIRKVRALKAKADKAATSAEAIAFLNGYNNLMKKYRLTETDLEVRQGGIGVSGWKNEKGGSTRSTRNPMGFVVLPIAELTQTALVTPRPGFNNWQFVGTPADVQYAEWLYSFIKGAMERSNIAFKMGVDYHRIINSGMKASEASHNYNLGFVFAVFDALKKMIEENKKAGNALILVKNDLIASFLKDNGATAAGEYGKAVALKDETSHLRGMGYEEGAKVQLRQGVADPNINGLLK